MGATVRAEIARTNNKRSAILRAAGKVFARRGYFNSKVADIARQAGVADGTVYLYFKSKDDVLISLVDQLMDDFISEGRAQLAKISDPREKLLKLARMHLSALGRDRDLAVVFQVELRQSTKFMERFSTTKMAEYLGLIREAFEEGQRQGIFRKDLHAKIVAKMMFGSLDEMATNWILSSRRYDLASFAETVIDILFRGVMAENH